MEERREMERSAWFDEVDAVDVAVGDADCKSFVVTAAAAAAAAARRALGKGGGRFWRGTTEASSMTAQHGYDGIARYEEERKQRRLVKGDVKVGGFEVASGSREHGDRERVNYLQ